MIWDTYCIYLLFLPCVMLNVIFYYNHISGNNYLYSTTTVFLWTLSINMFYYFIFSLFVLTIIYSNKFDFLNGTTNVFITKISIAMLALFIIFSCINDNLHRTAPALILSTIILIPVYINNGFLSYVLLVEFGSTILFKTFMKKESLDGPNDPIIGVVVLNFINTILLYTSVIFLIMYYGTTDVLFIKECYKSSYLENSIFIILVSSLLIKLGYFPVMYLKQTLYFSFDFVPLFFYTIVYNVFFLLPTICYIGSFLTIMPFSCKLVITVVLVVSSVPYLFSLRDLTDFLVLSYIIFVAYMVILSL